MADAVVVRDLTRRFGDFVAVDRVTFSVVEREVFGFLGPNGAGKTTTIKMLNGLLRPSAGEATVAGIDVTHDRRAVKERIGYMSQLFSLYHDLTVEENIQLFGGLYGLAGARFQERRDWVLEMSGLQHQRGQLTGELPLGWKQRLALGCAVLHEPPILFLDEPTSGVDPVARRAFWDLIYRFTESGTTVLVSTHYLQEAEYCHRVALMNRGRVIALDRPRRLREHLATPVLELTTDAPAAAVPVLRAHPLVIDIGLYGRSVHALVRNAAAGARDLPAALARAGITVGGVREVAPSLEDVFVALVQAEGGAAAG